MTMTAGPAPRHYVPENAGAMRLIRAMLARHDVAEILLERPGFKLKLS